MARFAEVYERWVSREITQVKAASLLVMSARTFRRNAARYKEMGLKGLEDGRSPSARRAPADEVAALERLYTDRYAEWSALGFFEAYRNTHGGERSYTWVKDRLQEARLAEPRQRAQSPLERGLRKPAEGMLVHHRAWIHKWLPGRRSELVAVIDDASSRVFSGLLVEEGTIWSRFRVIRETILAKGLFDAIYTDYESRHPHSRHAKQFERAMKGLGITLVPSCPPMARTRCNRVFRVLRECLPQQLARAEIQSTEEANTFLRQYLPKFNAFFAIEPTQETAAFDSLVSGPEAEFRDVLCLQETLEVGSDNRVQYRDIDLPIPAPPSPVHNGWKEVTVHEYEDGSLSVFDGRKRLARYDRHGTPVSVEAAPRGALSDPAARPQIPSKVLSSRPDESRLSRSTEVVST